MPLEEGSPDGSHQCALACLIGARKKVQAGFEVFQLVGLTELSKLLDTQTCQLHSGHAAAPVAALLAVRAMSWPARMARASREAWPVSVCAASRSSAMTSAR